MGIRIINNSEESLIIVDGRACVSDMEQIASEILKAAEPGVPTLCLNLEGITETDVSFIQLLLSLHILQQAAGHRLRMVALPSNHLVIQVAGLLGINLEDIAMIVENPE